MCVGVDLSLLKPQAGSGYAHRLKARPSREEPNMRRTMTAFLTLLMVALMSSAAAAQPAPFFQSASSSVNSSGALVVSFDERGLGNENVDYLLTADATALYACINRGGNHPEAANKESFEGQVSEGASIEPKNGRVQATLVTGPLSSGDFTCPGGQRLVLASVSYTNIVLTDTTNDVSITLADVSRTFFDV
jgi:hypothetical protein